MLFHLPGNLYVAKAAEAASYSTTVVVMGRCRPGDVWEEGHAVELSGDQVQEMEEIPAYVSMRDSRGLNLNLDNFS